MSRGRWQSNRQKPRAKRYVGKFWGINQVALESFRDRIPDAGDRAAAFELLATMLLGSRWNFHDPDAEFILSMRQINKLTGWNHNTIGGRIRTLADADILTVNRAGKAHKYKVDCEALGIRPMSERSKKKAYRPYTDEYFGLTRALMKRFREKIPHSKGNKGVFESGGFAYPKRGSQRSRCLWVLVNMMVYSDWKSYQPDRAFQMSLYELESLTGMVRNTVKKYRNMLIDAGFLYVYLPGGRGMAASYALDLGLAGIHAKAKNPVQRIGSS